MADLVFGLKLTADGSGFSAVRTAADDTKQLSDATQKLVDKYDPLNAKLRDLKASFAALNKEVLEGGGAGAEGSIDRTYQRLNAQIQQTEGLMRSVGAAGAEGFGRMASGGIAAALSTAQARRELIVLGHEALVGNFSRIPGSLLVLVERLGVTGAAFAAMAIPVVAVAAAVGGLIYLFASARSEMEAMDRAIESTGNFAGVTSGQIRAMAHEISDGGTLTVGTAQEIVTSLVASGRYSAENIDLLTRLTENYAAVTDQSASKAAAQLTKMFEDPAKASAQLNDQYHFLTIAQLEQIKNLQEMGDKQEAATVALKAFDGALPQHIQHLTGLASVWDAVTKGVSSFIDKIKSLGSDQFKLDALQGKIALLTANGVSPDDPDLKRLQAQVDAINQKTAAQRETAKAEGEERQALAENADRWKTVAQYADSYKKTVLEAKLASVRMFQPENEQQAAAQFDAIKKLEKEIANIGVVKAPKTDDYAREIEQLKKLAADASTEFDGLFQPERITRAEKALNEFMASGKWDKLSDKQKAAIIHQANIAIAIEKSVDARKRENEADTAYQAMLDRLDASEQRRIESIRKFVESLQDSNAKYAEETATIGMGATQRELYLSHIERENELKKTNNDVERKRINQLYDERDALIAARGAAQDMNKALEQQKEAWKRTYEDISNTIADSILGAFDKTRGGWKSLLDGMKSILDRYVFRPVIQVVMAPVTQALTGGVASFLGFSGGAQANPLGANPLSLLNFGGGASSLFTSFATSGIGAALGLSTPALTAAAATEPVAALAAGNVLTGLGSTIGTALPYVGLALMAAQAFGLFDKKPSQVRGQFGITPSSGGFEDNAFTKTPFGNIGFLDSGTQYFSGAGSQVFNQLIAGTLNAIATRLSPDQIARTSQRLQGISFAGKEGSFTTEDFIKQYGGDVLKQVVSVALEEVDPALSKLVAGFHGTADEITTFANALLTVHDAIGGNIAADVEKAWKANNGTIVESLADQRAQVLQLASTYDGSTEATQQLAQATSGYRQTLIAALVQIKQVKQAIDDMFAGTRQTLQTFGKSGRELYDFYRNDADAAMKQLATASDPATIQSLSQRVNNDINAAFNALPDSDKAGAVNPLLSYLNNIDAFVSQRLTTVGTSLTNDATSAFATVQTALNDAADKMGKAADGQQQAANTMTQAATTFSAGASRIANATITVQLAGAGENNG